MTINEYAVSQYQNAGKPLTMECTSDDGFVNEDGRYWVAVGPKILCQGYNERLEEEQTLSESDFKYGTEIDVVLQRMDDSNEVVYIECIVGDVMGHSYPNGVFQTGNPYPQSSNKDEDGSYARNGAYVEFINAPTIVKENKKDHMNGDMSDYKVIKIIVYEREW